LPILTVDWGLPILTADWRLAIGEFPVDFGFSRATPVTIAKRQSVNRQAAVVSIARRQSCQSPIGSRVNRQSPIGSRVNRQSPIGSRANRQLAVGNRQCYSPSAMAELDLWSMLFVFMLATFVGFQVIQNVSRLLHTPLMSLTNAISAIAIVGAIVVAGEQESTLTTVLGAIAVAASMTNIVSGFLITDRMLKMFREREPKR
jgi:NAD(P) transhydrogenase subunit alpha